MRTIVVHRGGLVSLGVATGTLAAAALMTTAPTASADDNPNVGGTGDIAVPALVPSDEYTNEFTIGVGNAEDTFTTTWDFTACRQLQRAPRPFRPDTKHSVLRTPALLI